MGTTTNAQLKLPEYTDVIDIADINGNFTKIDEYLGLSILLEAGAHGLRYYNGQFEYYDTTGEKWVAIAIYTLPEAGDDLGGVKTGGDVTISEGVITVNDNSHEHSNYATIDYVNGLIGEVEEVLTEVNTLLGGD